MLKRCTSCCLGYDDAEFSTICPHDEHVQMGAYCRRCDLFHRQYGPDCPLDAPT